MSVSSSSPSEEEEAELESPTDGVVALAAAVAAGASPTAVLGVGTAACPQTASPAETAASTSSPYISQLGPSASEDWARLVGAKKFIMRSEERSLRLGEEWTYSTGGP